MQNLGDGFHAQLHPRPRLFGGRQSHVGTYSTCLTYPQEVNLELVAVKSDSVTKETFASTDITTILSIRLTFVRNYLLCKLFVFKLSQMSFITVAHWSNQRSQNQYQNQIDIRSGVEKVKTNYPWEVSPANMAESAG